MTTTYTTGLEPTGPEPTGPEPTGPEPTGPEPVRSVSRPAHLVSAAIRVYQLARTGRVSPCRFTPTCSQYALEAVQRHGVGRGLRLAARRLGRCRPGGPSGYDPIPE